MEPSYATVVRCTSATKSPTEGVSKIVVQKAGNETLFNYIMYAKTATTCAGIAAFVVASVLNTTAESTRRDGILTGTGMLAYLGALCLGIAIDSHNKEIVEQNNSAAGESKSAVTGQLRSRNPASIPLLGTLGTFIAFGALTVKEKQDYLVFSATLIFAVAIAGRIWSNFCITEQNKSKPASSDAAQDLLNESSSSEPEHFNKGFVPLLVHYGCATVASIMFVHINKLTMDDKTITANERGAALAGFIGALFFTFSKATGLFETLIKMMLPLTNFATTSSKA